MFKKKLTFYADNNFIELMALNAIVNGMISENRCCEVEKGKPFFSKDDFYLMAEKMRALKSKTNDNPEFVK